MLQRMENNNITTIIAFNPNDTIPMTYFTESEFIYDSKKLIREIILPSSRQYSIYLEHATQSIQDLQRWKDTLRKKSPQDNSPCNEKTHKKQMRHESEK